MIMKYHGLGPIGAKAIAKTLEVKNDYEKLMMLYAPARNTNKITFLACS